MTEWTKERHEALSEDVRRVLHDYECDEVDHLEELDHPFVIGDVQDALAEIERLTGELARASSDIEPMKVEYLKALGEIERFTRINDVLNETIERDTKEIERLTRVAEAAAGRCPEHCEHCEYIVLPDSTTCDCGQTEIDQSLKAWREGK